MTRPPAAEAPLAATVLICSRNRHEMLHAAVDSVLAGAAVPAELLVVDQSAVASDRLAGLGTVRGCAIRYLHSGSRGLSTARNIGLKAATADVVVILDDDVFVERDWLQQLLGGLAQGDAGTIVTGRVLAAPDEGTGGVVPFAALVTRDTPAVFRGRQEIDVVPGANVAIHRATALAVGGYDERLGAGSRFPSGEDNDFGLRLLDAGCEVRHVPDAVILHRAWRTPRQRLRMRWDYGRGKGAFYVKHMRRGDRYTLRRMGADARARSRMIARALPREPRTALAHAAYLAGLLSGAIGWRSRELLGADRRRDPSF